MTAASAIAGWPIAAFSRSIELTHSPPDLMTSLVRSTRCRYPSGSMVATSPVGKKPSGVELVAALALEVAAGDPRTADEDLAESLAVPGQSVRRIVDDLELHAADATTLLELDCVLLRDRQARACLGSSRPTAQIGLVSVIPQPWTTSAPRSCSNAPASTRDAAEPPMPAHSSFEFVRVDLGMVVEIGEQHHPHRRHALDDGDASSAASARTRSRRPGAVPGRTSLAPTIAAEYGVPQALAWNIGTTSSSVVARCGCRTYRATAPASRAASSNDASREHLSGFPVVPEV